MDKNAERIPKPPDNWQTDDEVFEEAWQDLLKIQEKAHSRQKNILEDPLEYLTVID